MRRLASPLFYSFPPIRKQAITKKGEEKKKKLGVALFFPHLITTANGKKKEGGKRGKGEGREWGEVATIFCDDEWQRKKMKGSTCGEPVAQKKEKGEAHHLLFISSLSSD